ncbi:MAG: hypothetical protein WAL63_20540 [Solirubrobacteraceae bacterium]
MADPTENSAREAERQSRRMAVPATRFALVSGILAVPGAVLLLLGSGWVWAVGIALLALAIPPLTIAVGLLGSAFVTRWTSRNRPFA